MLLSSWRESDACDQFKETAVNSLMSVAILCCKQWQLGSFLLHWPLVPSEWQEHREPEWVQTFDAKDAFNVIKYTIKFRPRELRFVNMYCTITWDNWWKRSPMTGDSGGILWCSYSRDGGEHSRGDQSRSICFAEWLARQMPSDESFLYTRKRFVPANLRTFFGVVPCGSRTPILIYSFLGTVVW
jgi:hypothetical protein